MSVQPAYEELGKRVGSLQKECDDLKRMITVLLDSEVKYRTFFENSMDAMFIGKSDGMVLEANAAACEMFGYTEEELIRGGRNAVTDPDDVRLLPALMERERTGRFAGELTFKRKDGTRLPVEITSVIFRTTKGDERASVIVRDISERKHADNALRKSETFIRTIMDHLPIGLAVNSVDPSVNFVYMNDNFPRYYRTTREALADPDTFWYAAYEDPVFREEIRKRVLEDCASNDPARMHWEYVPITRQGEETTFIHSRNTPVPEKSLMISTVWDVTESKRAEETARRETSLRNILLDNLPCAALVLKKQTREIVACNEIAKKYGAVVGRVCHDVLAVPGIPCPFCQAHEVWESGESRQVETEYMGRFWQAVWVPFSDDLYVHYIFDITERKQSEIEREKLQKQLLTSQRMEAVGTLAGGIAHDFNNALMGIIGFTEVLKGNLSHDRSALSDLNEIMRSAERASMLTRQLLTYARRQIIDPVNLDLNRVITELMNLVSKVVGEQIEIRTFLAKDLPAIHADVGQIEQVLMNLALNARDAMPGGGSLLVETGLVHLDPDYCRSHPDVKPGSHVVLTFSDTGIGMDKGIEERVFEPFFTTKGPDQGTGLGLSMVYGIVKQHNGFIHLYSVPGKGTTFKIYLPAVEETPDAVVLPKAPQILGGTETVLLAEDDESVRRLIERTLKGRGYTVLVTRDGEEIVRESFVLNPGVSFLSKPFSPGALVRKIREVLDNHCR